METFTKLFGSLLVFWIPLLRPDCDSRVSERIAAARSGGVFFRNVVGEPMVSKELLSKRTGDYQRWGEAYARNREIPAEWAERDQRQKHSKVELKIEVPA